MYVKYIFIIIYYFHIITLITILIFSIVIISLIISIPLIYFIFTSYYHANCFQFFILFTLQNTFKGEICDNLFPNQYVKNHFLLYSFQEIQRLILPPLYISLEIDHGRVSKHHQMLLCDQKLKSTSCCYYQYFIIFHIYIIQCLIINDKYVTNQFL